MTDDRETAVVAGGTAGVGRAVVSDLIDRGYRVGVLARGKSRLDAMSRQYGDQVLCLQCDVTEPETVARCGAAIEETLGPVSVWVNSAMLTSFSPFPSMTPGEFDRIVDTTLQGTVNGTRTALALMERRGTGRIVNVGSGLAYRSVPYQSAYCAAKHGVNGFTSALRSELIREESGVTLSLVQLPALNTPQFTWARNRLSKKPQPAPPIFAPSVGARAVMRAVRTGRREYLVGRSVVKLFLADMVLPDWMDHRLSDAGAEMQKSRTDEPGGRPDNLDTPVEDVPPSADGAFSENAREDALVVDGDRLRKAVFFGVPAGMLALGLIVG